MKKIIHRLRGLLAGIVIVLGLGTNMAMAADVVDIDFEIVSAPILANGLVASEPTEFNLLVGSADPAVPGLRIPAGGRLDVILGGTYVPNPDFVGFLPARHIILTTGPQNPIKPNTEDVSGGFWRVESSNPNKVSVIPRCDPAVVDSEDPLFCDNAPNGLNGTRAGELGINVIHIRPNNQDRQHIQTPFYNGPASTVGTVEVQIFNAADEMVAAGTESIIFPESVGPQVHPTNVLTRDDFSVISLTNFQRVAKNTEMTETTLPGTPAPGTTVFADGGPYAMQFYLFEDFGVHDPAQFPTHLDGEPPVLPVAKGDSFIPMPGIADLTVENTNDPTVARLMSGGEQIGTAVISGPAFDAKGKKNSQSLIKGGEATIVQLGNGTVLFLPVKVGRAAGEYQVTVSLNGGNSTTQTVIVE